MRKLKKGRKLHRERDQRRALIKILATNLILQGRIKTTRAKAKELASFIEKQITKAKRNSLADIRQLRRYFSKEIVAKLVKEIAPRYKERSGGYTRILKVGPRDSDTSQMVIIEFVK